jgi:hypothetical protein
MMESKSIWEIPGWKGRRAIMERTWLSVLGLLVTALVLFGCPVNGPCNCPTKNSITIHNNSDVAIVAVTWFRWRDTDSNIPMGCSKGYNVLPTAIQPGRSFTIGDLGDGIYNIALTLEGNEGHSCNQDLRGGIHVDWYFDVAKGAECMCTVDSTPTIWRVLECLLGL